MPPRHCFLSHSHYNETFADKLADVLAWHGIEVWYSPRELKGGQQWHDEIGRALSERCDWFLIVLSPSAVKSTWVKHELVYALNNTPFKDGRITPLLARTVNGENCHSHSAVGNGSISGRASKRAAARS